MSEGELFNSCISAVNADDGVPLLTLTNEHSAENKMTLSLADFVKKHFPLKSCKRYVKIKDIKFGQACSELKENDCVCGQSLDWHVQRDLLVTIQTQEPGSDKSKDECWVLSEDTKDYTCDTFGELIFEAGKQVDPKSIAHGATAKFIRLQGACNNDHLFELMASKKYWNMPKPQLIIEVTGSAQNLPLVDRQAIQVFDEGLIQAARSANAWLVTGGTNCGVMRLVGEAVSKHHMSHGEEKVTCLGIASWGIVDNRQCLVQESDRDTPVSPVSYVVHRRKPGGYSPLDPGHNYFILVDNGIEKRFGEEIRFRADFTAYLTAKLSKTAHNDCGTSSSQPCPLVQLVIGGGPNTLETIKESVGFVKDDSEEGQHIDETMKRPVVVLPGFGGAADLLAYAYEITGNDEEECAEDNNSAPLLLASSQMTSFPEKFDDKIKNHSAFTRLLAGSGSARDRMVRRTIQSLKECLHDRKLITVVNIFKKTSNKPNSLDKAILEAIFKAKANETNGLLALFTLAQQWNQDEIAQVILNKSLEQDSHDTLKRFLTDPREAMTRAILHDQSRFFELLVEYNVVDMNEVDYFTIADMLECYWKVFISTPGAGKAPKTCVSFFRSMLLKDTTPGDVENMSEQIGDALANIMGCAMNNFFEEPSNLNRGEQRCSQYYEPGKKVRDLFLFSLLLKRSKFAEILWRDSTEHLGTSLIGTIFLKQLGDRASQLDLHDLAEDYRKLSEVWQQRLMAMLTKCYDTKPESTHRMLTRCLSLWQGKTVMALAFNGREKRFIAHTAVQGKLKQVWYGRIASFTPSYLVICVALLPVLLVVWPFKKILFVPTENDCKNDSKKGEQPTKTNNLQQSSDSGKERGGDDVADFPCIKEYDEGESTLVNEEVPALLEPVAFYSCRREKRRDNAISLTTALCFVYSAPMVKFLIHSLAMFCFLLLFTFFVLTFSKNDRIAATEVVIWIWSFSFFLEDLLPHFHHRAMSFTQIKASFVSDLSVLISGAAEFLMLESIVIRCFLPLSFEYGQTTYALSCLIFWVNSLRFFYVIEVLGPKVITLIKMFQELIFFLVIYVILLFAFSVAIHALLEPGQEIQNVGDFFRLLVSIIYVKWWNLVGLGLDTSLEAVEGSSVGLEAANETAAIINGTLFRFPYIISGEKRYHVVAVPLLILYLFLTNIMLLNLLVALLLMKVDEVQADSFRLWRFGYYRVVTSYYRKILLPPPFNILHMIYYSLRNHPAKQGNDLKVHLDPNGPEYTKLDLLEQSVMLQVLAAEKVEQEK